MLLAACADAGADAGVTTLYTEDLSTGILYGSALAMNPFASAP